MNTPQSLRQHLMLDVRTREEFAEGNAPGSINVPLNELFSYIKNIPHDTYIAVFCASGARATTAAQMLKDAGFVNVTCLGSWLNVVEH